jgi:alkanesulfonate monooxygenase SsuD/methylene tetrahydromethanopterin reductase-like flavin-dependent oxidoreductase (luciferase family)
MLAAAAQRTSRLRLGTLITILSLYHPMRIIEEAVTLDQLSDGRLALLLDVKQALIDEFVDAEGA